MFRSEYEFAGYKAVELEGALTEIIAERRSIKGQATNNADVLPKAPEEPLMLWIDKVKGPFKVAA